MLKRYLAEFIGTFAIVFAPIAYSANTGGAGLLGAALVSGLIVLAMVFALGSISAAHFNPAVTLAFAVAGRFPWKYVLAYWIAQFLGAVLASAWAILLFGVSSGAHVPADPNAFLRNLGVEASITFVLMFVIMAVATDRKVPSSVPAIAIGFAVIIGVLVAGPITGGSMNPARSLGPAIVAGGSALSNLWIYLTAPCLGAILAAKLFEFIRIDRDSVVNAPNDI